MKKLAIGSIIFMGLITLKISVSPIPNWKASLVNPISWISSPSPSATPTSPNAPKTYQFDGSTDLKEELETINPQILDSDFDSQ